jgi:Tol biopolymer transport system component
MVLCAVASPLALLVGPVSLISGNNVGEQGNGNSNSPTMSADGRFVAFTSNASDLIPNDTNGSVDIFVKDRQTQVVERVSVRSDGSDAAGDSTAPAISANGRYVAFVSNAALAADDTNSCAGATPSCSDIYVHDRQTGQTTRVSVPFESDTSGANVSSAPTISDDGRFVAFSSLATNLVNDGGGNGQQDVYLRDRTAGTTIRASLANGASSPSDGSSSMAEISRDGRFVLFLSSAHLDASPDAAPCVATAQTSGPCTRMYLRDAATGTVARVGLENFLTLYPLYQTSRVDIQTATLSADGRTIVFTIALTVPSTPATLVDRVLVYDRATGTTREVLTLDSANRAKARMVAIDPSGRYAAYCDTSLQSDRTETRIIDLGGMDAPFVLPATGSGIPKSCGDVSFSDFGLQLAYVGPGSRFDPAREDVFGIDRDDDHDGMLDSWEQFVGLQPGIADGGLDPDGDGKTNAQEFVANTLPTGTFVRYLAEGATNAFFVTSIYVYNPSTTVAAVTQVRYLGDSGQSVTQLFTLAPGAARTLLPIAPDASFSTVVESNHFVAVERTMTWGAGGSEPAYGSSAETAVTTPSDRWYFAEGATHGAFSLFYLLQNANDTAANVTITYLLPSGQAPILRNYQLAPQSRLTIPVDAEPGLDAADVSAQIVSDVAIFAERSMYMSTSSQPFSGGTAGAGIPTPATQWFIAEGATGSFFDLYVLIGNPSLQDADVTVRFLLPEGISFNKSYLVTAQSRRTISVAGEDPRVAATALSAAVTSTNDVPIVVERAMWWPSPNWHEGSLTAATHDTATAWALAGGEIPPGAGDETYLLVANPSDSAATVTFALRQGANGENLCDHTASLAARSRYTIGLKAQCSQLNVTGGAIYGTVRSDGPGIVVERSTYQSNGTQFWAAGASTLLTRIP